MRKLLLLIIILVLVGLAWTQRERIRALLSRETARAEAAELEPSAELADQAEVKLEDLRAGRTRSAVFHSAELQSLLQYRFVQLLPAFVDAPVVELDDGKLEVTANVPVDRLPSISELGDAASFLPDTAEVALTGRLLPLDNRRVALSIQEVKAARIPLPQRLVPRALQRLGRKDEPGLPRNALALPLPKGVTGAYVDGDSLVLLSGPRQ